MMLGPYINPPFWVGGPTDAATIADLFLRQFALYGVDPRLGALLVLVGRAATDANPTDLCLICGHDWKTPGKRDDARKISNAGHHAGLALLAEGNLAELACREGEFG